MGSAGTSQRPWAARRRARARLATTLLVAASLLLGGCGLRLETPPPQPLVPGELEQVRQRSTADALALHVLSGQAADQATDEAVRAVLVGVQAVAVRHLEALGGIYDPGTSPDAAEGTTAPGGAPTGTTGPTDTGGETEPTPADPSAGDPAAADPTTAGPTATDPAATPAPAPATTVTAEQVVALLTDTAASARADAGAAPDGMLARLLCSVAVSRELLADSLRTAAALPAADVAVGTTGPFEVPETVPPGLAAADVADVVQSEDAIAMAWEVMAARSSDDARTQAAEQARLHRDRAESWALAAGILGTGLDPRRTAYDLPDVLTAAAPDPTAMAAALTALEGELAVDYTSLVASAEAGARTPLVDAALDATRTHVRLGGAATAFPGMPEQSA